MSKDKGAAAEDTILIGSESPGHDSDNILRRRALRLDQNESHALFLFSLKGSEILQLADISRISRNDAGMLIGYQRPEVKGHVGEILEYLEGPDIIFPNSIILALSSRVRFVRSRGPHVNDDLAAAGILEIPLPDGTRPKPAWIVDGQQRAIAISMSSRRNFPIPISAFIADEIPIQRDQFIRVNNTKPLPRGLLTELLPEVSTPLPSKLAARRIPAAICDLLASDETSPFHGLIRRASTSSEQQSTAVIADLSVVRMIEESINSPSGCLFPYRNMMTGETDFDGIWKILATYWGAVKKIFPEAWGQSPTKSRLMHGAGIRSMGRLMDRVISSLDPASPNFQEVVELRLRGVAPHCRWTSGRWEALGGIEWKEIQNVPRHIALLSNFLIRVYLDTTAERR